MWLERMLLVALLVVAGVYGIYWVEEHRTRRSLAFGDHDDA